MWFSVFVLSAFAGLVCGWFIRGRRAITWGAAVPWLGMLAWLLYNEYLLPYRGGGASMWPIAQLIAGTVAAAVGALAASIARKARAKLPSSTTQ